MRISKLKNTKVINTNSLHILSLTLVPYIFVFIEIDLKNS